MTCSQANAARRRNLCPARDATPSYCNDGEPAFRILPRPSYCNDDGFGALVEGARGTYIVFGLNKTSRWCCTRRAGGVALDADATLDAITTLDQSRDTRKGIFLLGPLTPPVAPVKGRADRSRPPYSGGSIVAAGRRDAPAWGNPVR